MLIHKISIIVSIRNFSVRQKLIWTESINLFVQMTDIYLDSLAHTAIYVLLLTHKSESGVNWMVFAVFTPKDLYDLKRSITSMSDQRKHFHIASSRHIEVINNECIWIYNYQEETL